MQRVHNLLEEVEGDVFNPEVAALKDELLTGTDADMARKVDGYCAMIRDREATSRARKEEAQRIDALAKQDAQVVAKLKERLKFFFDDHGITKLETPLAKLSIVNNGGAR